jgi:hypothetical protein
MAKPKHVGGVPKKREYDPGIYRLAKSNVEFGRLNVLASNVETFALYLSYTPAGQNTVGEFRSLYADPPMATRDFVESISEAFNEIKVTVTMPTASGTTGSGGASPGNYMRMFDQGRYDIYQGGFKVGDLLVEHVTNQTRKQHWFLYTKSTATTGVYLQPSSINTDVDTRFVWAGSYVPTNLGTYANLPSAPIYKLGTENFMQTHT